MGLDRRKFMGQTLKASAFISTSSALPMASIFEGTKTPNKIDKIELYRYDNDIPRYFSWGTWYNRQQIFMKMTSGDFVGWSETNGSKNNPALDLKKWGEFLKPFTGMRVNDAYALIKANQNSNGKFSVSQLEFIEMSLLDLLGRIEEKPAITLIGLHALDPVSGLFCILNNDLKEIEQNIHKAITQGLDTHVKFKMYGKRDFDLEIVKLARPLLGKDAFILSDVNKGYKNWRNLDELAEILIELREAGLNACEDPAKLTQEEWIRLQQKVGELSLVPDYVLRPSWEGIHNLKTDMGRYYNMHPDTMGSLHGLSALGKKIKTLGGGIMIGDASLVGPACSAWQQIAIGSGASWVEAIEKNEDSEGYLECLISKPTYRDDNGKFAVNPTPGFGVHLDEEKLIAIAKRYTTV